MLTREPRNVPALVNLGALKQAYGSGADAKALFARAIAVDPACVQAHNNLGLIFAAEGDETRAIEAFARAVAIQPEMTVLRFNLAGALERDGRPAEALAQLDAIVAREPEHVLAQLGRIGPLFALGRFDEGWIAYTWRYRPFWAQSGGNRPLPQPVWRGQLLAGKKILLCADQGLGEQMMFASFVPELLAAGARLVIECEPRLMPLFTRAFPGVEIVPWSDPWNPAVTAPGIDFQIPIGDAGRWLRGNFADVTPPVGYLKADPAKAAQVRDRYEALAKGRRIVGLSWLSTATLGAFKSAPLKALKPLLSDPGLFVVSLQYGVRLSDVPGLYFDPDIDPGADLEAAAAQIMACDLVVSVSNTTAHLAGALGRPSLLMLSRSRGRHWYWLPDRDPNPWYPSVRPFVQARDGDWSDVVRRIVAAVGEQS